MADDIILYCFIAGATFVIMWGPQSVKILFKNIFKSKEPIVIEEVYEADDSKPSLYTVPTLGDVWFVRMRKVRTENIGEKPRTLYDYVFDYEGKEVALPYWDDDWKEVNPHTSGSRHFVMRDTNEMQLKSSIQRKAIENAQLQEEVDQFRKSRKRMEMEDAEHYGEMAKKLRPTIFYNKDKKKGGEQEGEMEGGGESGQ